MTRWLVRMSHWARHPPSARRVILVLAIIAACLAIFGFEWLGLWPDWATTQKMRR